MNNSKTEKSLDTEKSLTLLFQLKKEKKEAKKEYETIHLSEYAKYRETIKASPKTPYILNFNLLYRLFAKSFTAWRIMAVVIGNYQSFSSFQIQRLLYARHFHSRYSNLTR